MDFQILMGLFVGCLVSGLLPLVNAELLVVAAAAAVPVSMLPAIVLVAAVGQMVTKTSLYGVARWAPSRLGPRARTLLARASERTSRRGGAVGTTIFASAISGLPPFYGVSLAAGALGVRTGTFVLTGLAGRAGRFALLAWGAHQVGAGVIERLTATLSATLGVGA
jgi:membrane protein YqaA with SNARE-associated domain